MEDRRADMARLVEKKSRGPIAIAHRGGQRPALRGAGRRSSSWCSGRGSSTRGALLARRAADALGAGRGPDARADRRARRARRRQARSSSSAAAGARCRSWMAERYPSARITRGLELGARSASTSRRARASRGLANLEVVTCGRERLRARAALRSRGVGRDVRAHAQLARAARAHRAAGWSPTAALFVHVFSPPRARLPASRPRRGDWMARHFFTGG